MKKPTFKEALERADTLLKEMHKTYADHPDVATIILLAAVSRLWAAAAFPKGDDAKLKTWVEQYTWAGCALMDEEMKKTSRAEEICALFFTWTAAMVDFLSTGLERGRKEDGNGTQGSVGMQGPG